MAQNHPKEEIIRGLHRAIVNRVWNMIKTVRVHGAVTMSGGVAKNRGTEPQIVSALGAALMAGKQAK